MENPTEKKLHKDFEEKTGCRIYLANGEYSQKYVRCLEQIVIKSLEDSPINNILESLRSKINKNNIGIKSSYEGYALLKTQLEEMWFDIKQELFSHSRLVAFKIAEVAIKYYLSLR